MSNDIDDDDSSVSSDKLDILVPVTTDGIQHKWSGNDAHIMVWGGHY